ncbi:MAG: ERCC4-related helicase [Candidatus Nanohaloarchaea archaeon]|jgi:ERCC4-related helicase
MSDLLKTENIEQRTYQGVIAASAMDKNTLVVLPTGLGKTVIAAMVAAKKLEEGKVLFMAPTKPLVQQHLKTFNEFLHVDSSVMHIMTGSTRPAKRYEKWQEGKIFFGTPQVVENDLISGEVPTEDFSLVIFDEAHRATGEYSYVFINEKMNAQKLALTASPGGSKEKIMEVADNLNIENFEVRTEDDPDVEPFIEDKEVDWRHVSLDDTFEKAREHLQKGYRSQLKDLKSMGMLDSTSDVHKGELLKLRGEISSKLSTSDDSKLYSAISKVATGLKISQAIELLETQGVTQAYDYIQGLETDESKAAARALEDEDVQRAKRLITHLKKKGVEHPKMEELVDILGDVEDENAIVFTEYRASASKIVEEIETTGLSATNFIGQQGEEGMSQSEQIETLDEFENGKYDVLVSTSIGEEGLDIPAVDYVIFYEPVASGIRDIQRAGRTGRQEEGTVIVLIAENTRDEGNYWSAYHKKKKMNKVLQELKQEDLESSKQQTLEQNYDSEEADEEEDEDEVTIVVDDRENSVAKEISRREIGVDKTRLDVADFMVSDDTVVERKRTDDFVDSIVDNRLFDQIRDITQFPNPVLLLEGENLYTHRDISPKAIQGALTSIILDYDMPILWSNDEEETVELLLSMAKREQEERDKDVAVRGTSEGKTQSEMQEFIAAGLPGVNTKIAERLLEEFDTLEKVFTASEEELRNVEGIGEKKAEKIRSMITSKYR